MLGALEQEGALLFFGNGSWRDGVHALLLNSPVERIAAHRPSDLRDTLEAVERRLGEGMYVAGYLSYEAASAFKLPCKRPEKNAPPMAWFAAYHPRDVETLSLAQLERLLVPQAGLSVGKLRVDMSKGQYISAVQQIKQCIAAGQSYQVNLTCRGILRLTGSAGKYFLAMLGFQPVPYAAYLNLGGYQVLSLSPELFLARRGGQIVSRPMKGTRPRGRTGRQDQTLARQLARSSKDRAENAMIVDMMRNDLGRLCRLGTVGVRSLFEVEAYRTVLQMTSTVYGRLDESKGLWEIFEATFPPASVTGAPKRQTMHIIRRLETTARGVYTGSVGLFCPDGDFTCNVAIRTLVCDGSSCRLGIGSGIVWDSDPTSEYHETLVKGRFAFPPLGHVPGNGRREARAGRWLLRAGR